MEYKLLTRQSIVMICVHFVKEVLSTLGVIHPAQHLICGGEDTCNFAAGDVPILVRVEDFEQLCN